MKFALPFLFSGLFLAVVVWTLVNSHPVQMPPVALPKEKPAAELAGVVTRRINPSVFSR